MGRILEARRLGPAEADPVVYELGPPGKTLGRFRVDRRTGVVEPLEMADPVEFQQALERLLRTARTFLEAGQFPELFHHRG